MLSSLLRFSEQGGLSVDYSRTRVFQMPPHIRASLGLFGAIMWVWGRWRRVCLGPASVPGETTQGGEHLLSMDHQASLTCQRASPRTFDATSCVVSRQARLPPYWREGWGLRETQWLTPGHTASRGELKLPWAGASRVGVGGGGILGVKIEFLRRACLRRAGVPVNSVHNTQVSTDTAQSTFRRSAELSWASSYWVPYWLCDLELTALCLSKPLCPHVWKWRDTLSLPGCSEDSQQEAQSERVTEGSAFMEGVTPWRALLGTWEMAHVFGFSQDLVTVGSTGHWERERESPFPGDKKSNIFLREIFIHLAIVLGLSFLFPGKFFLFLPKRTIPIAPGVSLCLSPHYSGRKDHWCLKRSISLLHCRG